MRWIIIFLLANFWPAVYSQTWVGTYNINSTCDTTICCCFTNQIMITPLSPYHFGVNTTLGGDYCFGLTSYYADVANPNSYTITTTISIITLTFQLSSDSSTITISNSLSPSCDEVAVRQAVIVQTTTVQTASVPTTTVPTTTVQTTTIQTTTGQTTTVQTTTSQTTAVHSNAVPQYVNIIMLCSLAFFPIVMSF